MLVPEPAGAARAGPAVPAVRHAAAAAALRPHGDALPGGDRVGVVSRAPSRIGCERREIHPLGVDGRAVGDELAAEEQRVVRHQLEPGVPVEERRRRLARQRVPSVGKARSTASAPAIHERPLSRSTMAWFQFETTLPRAPIGRSASEEQVARLVRVVELGPRRRRRRRCRCRGCAGAPGRRRRTGRRRRRC